MVGTPDTRAYGGVTSIADSDNSIGAIAGSQFTDVFGTSLAWLQVDASPLTAA